VLLLVAYLEKQIDNHLDLDKNMPEGADSNPAVD
jgi:hypothetical protein